MRSFPQLLRTMGAASVFGLLLLLLMLSPAVAGAQTMLTIAGVIIEIGRAHV